jgi:allophanate hydrolase
VTDLSLGALRVAYADGVRPVDVAKQVAARVDATHDLHGWIHVVAFDELVRAAERLGSWTPDCGPLWGVPFAVKDNIDVEGVPTTAACPAFAHVPPVSAPCVDRLRAAGALFVGKTNMDQFATGLSGARSPYGLVRSTIDPSLIGGGSSSGSAVAVAAGVVAFALATDTAGSGRVPAACQGVVGSKPSVGLVSNRGVVPACASLDCVSVFARDVGDAAAVVDAIAGFDPEDPFSRRVTPVIPTSSQLRIGVPSDPAALGIPRAYEPAAERVAATLEAELVPVDVTPHLEAGALLYHGAWLAERYEAVGRFLDEHPDDVEPTVAAVVSKGRDITGAAVFADIHRREVLARRADATWTQCDVLLLPTVDRVPTVDEMLAEPIEANARLGRFTTFVNLLRMAAVAFPAGSSEDGAPFGLSFIGREGTDRWLHGLAARAVAALR